jgi:CheY-like chemotaxis protein
MCANSTTQRPARVLVVEDSHVQAALVQYAVDEIASLELLHIASDGEEALAYLRNEPGFESAERPDVILLDLNMPRKNGFEVLDEVKQDDRLKTIPVIMFTTSELETDVAHAYKRGANTFITKPVGFDALIQTLEDLARYWANAKLATE